MKRNLVDYREVKRVELDGRSFRSKAEAQMYLYLKQLKKLGEVKDLRCEQRVQLLPGGRGESVDYYADFVVFDTKLGCDVWIEVKGFETDKWKIKKKLWKHFGPGTLRIYKLGWNKLQLDEEIESKGGRIVYGDAGASSGDTPDFWR